MDVIGKTQQSDYAAAPIVNTEPLRIHYDNGEPDGVEGVDYGCKKGDGNCLPTIVVNGYASIYTVLTDLATASGTSTGYSDIKNIFQSSYSTLNNYLDNTLIEGVIHGNYNLSLRGDLQNEDNLYLIFEENNQLINVQPFHVR